MGESIPPTSPGRCKEEEEEEGLRRWLWECNPEDIDEDEGAVPGTVCIGPVGDEANRWSQVVKLYYQNVCCTKNVSGFIDDGLGIITI